MGDAVKGGVAGIEAVVRILEHDLDVAALRRLVELAGRDARDQSPSKTMSPSSGSSKRQTRRDRVLLPEPDSPTRPERRPAPTGTRRRRRQRVRPPNDFTTPLQLEQGRRAGAALHRPGAGPPAHRARDRRGSTDASARRRPAGACRDGRRLEQAHGRALLDHPPGLHDGDPVTPPCRQAEIVSDQDHGHAALGLDAGQELHHGLLRRDVEAGRRLVGDQQGRLAGDRHGDHDALAHAARQFVRIGRQPRLRIADAHRRSSSSAWARAEPRRRPGSRSCAASTSTICRPTVRIGLRLHAGSERSSTRAAPRNRRRSAWAAR